MLGRLLHLGSGGSATTQTQTQSSTPRPILSLESVQEDIHTRNLLFPDADALYQHRNDQVFPLHTSATPPATCNANPFDFSEDIDLDVRDVRVLIMQDALGPANASLLFDSHPPPESLASPDRSPSGRDNKWQSASSRKGSLSQNSRPVVIQPDSPQPRQGAFDRRASLHGRTQSSAETESQRTAREYREELATFSSCIFGNSELMAYKGTSTKVHVVPSNAQGSDQANSSYGDGRSSVGRSSGARASKLSQSFSSQVTSPTLPQNLPSAGGSARQNDRKKVLITRLFPVNLSPEDLDAETPSGRLSDDNSSFPFPATTEDVAPKKKKPQPKQRRTPMYAVVLVVQLPSTTSRMSSAMPPKSAFRESGSYNDGDFFPSSYNSARAAAWLSGSGTYGEASESTFSVDVEDRIDSLTQHWDIIMRTLTHLQSLVATNLYTMLKQADAASPGPYSASGASNRLSRAPSVTERRGEMSRPKPPKSTTKLVSLLPNCLASDVNIASEVGLARTRIVMGLSAARVITGQGRWGIWRDEAIWTAKWSATMDHGNFFYKLLTGFLATHTDWLQALCSPTYRRRALLNRRSRDEEDMSLPARTIIVSDDKMAARRMIFLLSAFLPANQQMPAARTHRPSTSMSVGPFSNSPPTYIVPVLREESLRRKINRRSGLRRASHSRVSSQSTKASTIPGQVTHVGMDVKHQRRASDATSIRTTSLPMPGNDLVSRKSTTAATATVMTETSMPHFANVPRGDSQRRYHTETSESAVVDDLKRSLNRGDSSGAASNGRPTSQGLKWGNLMSGLWNTRRRDSLESSTISQGGDLRSPVKSSFARDKLSEMVREATLLEEEADSDPLDLPRTRHVRDLGTPPRESVDRPRGSFSQIDRTPDPTGAFESPVKTSINAEDGIIDVDVPFPDYMASFESAISSPSSSGYLSTPGLPGGAESFEQASRINVDGDMPFNSAGWLSRYHPDFTLQAIPPQDHLMDKIKASLRAEPTPPPAQPIEGDVSERWVDVSSVVIADTTTNVVTRLVYRRLVKPRAATDKPSHPGAPGFYGGILLTPSILPYETQLEEEWIEEPIVNFDEGLADAVDRIVHLSPDASKESSAASSQAPSEIRGSGGSDSGTLPDGISEITQTAYRALDTPRVQCKSVVLSALEDTIRDAMDHRDDHEIRSNGANFGRENVLREAVQQWVTNLDNLE